MAKVGYIFHAAHYDGFDADRRWMEEYGCVQVVEEMCGQEKQRPAWKQLLQSLGRGDELVVSKFSNAVRGVRELAVLLELCRVKVVRLISIHDRIDSKGEMFPDTKTGDVLEMFGSLPEETAALRMASAHVARLKMSQKKAKTDAGRARADREECIVHMYDEGRSIDEIWEASGFKSRSSVFRILNKHGVTLNRGPHQGPLKKRKDDTQ
jgi:DNA invertase Pin-like site-specific DNA recombinase